MIQQLKNFVAHYVIGAYASVLESQPPQDQSKRTFCSVDCIKRNNNAFGVANKNQKVLANIRVLFIERNVVVRTLHLKNSLSVVHANYMALRDVCLTSLAKNYIFLN